MTDPIRDALGIESDDDPVEAILELRRTAHRYVELRTRVRDIAEDSRWGAREVHRWEIGDQLYAVLEAAA